MLIADLRPHLSEKFVQIYDEFMPVCAHDFQAASFLSNLFWWSDVADKEPKRCGWLYKTAADLKQELGLTRRGYEKVRRTLLKLGLVQYRRGGVHGRMHWYLNREVLLDKICELRGIPVPEKNSRHHYDRDNYRLPKFIPLDLWHNYLDMRIEAGKKAGTGAKKTAIKQLAAFHNQNLDLRPIMERSILKGWLGFYHNDNNQPNRPSEVALKAQEERTRRELDAAAKERQKHAPPQEKPDKPPPEKPDLSGNDGYQAIQNYLKKGGMKSGK
ncbi:hypothetical protein [Neisseria sp. 74A18]|uniref:hypothetical protein n=1 Tax=Neisseria sp. 74A18 TaxID=1696094 RepID=UPI0006CAF32D|nr:hypothetical protein [Neisseria sp. 74A18]KPN73235.1 hypothetical protein AKG43_09170 [Neisseria sp. 74A18]